MRLVPLDDALEKIQMQKAATPVPRPDGLREAGEILETTKANAVVCEKSSFDEIDINAQRIEAVRTFVQRLDEECAHGGADDTSNSSEDEEDGGKAERASKRGRVHEGVPSGANEAAREAVERDMLTQVEQLTPAEIAEGAKQIYQALDGKYVDINNRKQKVNGDMTKVRHVPTLGKAAHKLLTHIEHTSRRLSGTQEARRVMRFETNALRVRYGVPIFVTFSPDEGHNLLMVRLSRTRRQDPVHKAADDEAQSRLAGGRGWPRVAPDMDGLQMDLPMAAGEAEVPPWNERRRILARDPMASVDGFRILVDAALRHLFGVRICPNCPRCNEESGDLYGFLPIAEGMPVALTDHIDRSEDKNLLRGRVGRVQSWVCDGDGVDDRVTRGGETILKKTPKVIFVLFDEGDDGNGGRKPCQWTIEGLKTPGLYPVIPQKKDWFVDMLIFRPFDIAPYQKKDERKGPDLLLRTLRGEELDWEAIEREFMPSGRCAVCGCTKYKNMYPTVGQWSRADGLRVCSVCMEDKKRAGTPWQCMECGLWKCQEAFHASQHHPSKLTTRRCVDCPERRSCRVCEDRKYEQAFAAFQWDKAGNARCKGGMCLECEELKKHLTCSRCGQQKLPVEFAKAEQVNDEPTCKACKKSQREVEKARAEEAKRVVCSACGAAKSKAEFSSHMLVNASEASIACTTCVDAATAQRNMAASKDVKTCVGCGVAQRRDCFSRKMWDGVVASDRKCKRCVDAGAAQRDAAARKDERACVACGVAQRRECFSQWMWEGVAERHRKCKRCIDGAKLQRGKWKCVECKGAFEREHYSTWLAGRTTQKADGKQRCNGCCAGQERKRKEVAERSLASVTKIRKAG
ncbi:unnamed protein product [Prorocentrum cordatum]|uniref:Uncharacterized protein n=1 Tax=Prorocentrum cordatum TaxID=2364126 RepID=A0ABN9X1K3_9DINO|nr:unnamed protein product [Polarella glacialis]